MKIYLAHPITGLGYDEVVSYYLQLRLILTGWGYDVLMPMTGKSYLRNETKFKSEGFSNPVSTNHAIFERDMWMIRQADVVYVDLTGASCVSIGCVMELAAASVLGKHTVIVLPPDAEDRRDPHRHAFVLEAADVIFSDSDAAREYLRKLVNQIP